MIANVILAGLRPRFAGKSRARRYKLARQLIDEAFDRYRNAPDTPALGCQSSNCFGCCQHQKKIDISDYEADRILNRVTSGQRLEDVVKLDMSAPIHSCAEDFICANERVG